MSWLDELISRIIWPRKRPQRPKTRWEKLKARVEALLRDRRALWEEHRLAVIGAGTVLAAAVVLVAYLAVKRPGDVLNTDAAFTEFTTGAVTGITDWPTYGYNGEHTRHLDAKRIDPPFRKVWAYNSGALMEFSPVSVGKRIYGVNNDGKAFALDANNGAKLWERDVGNLNASSPAHHNGRLFIVNLDPAQAVAIDAETGSEIWQRDLPGRSESSPVVADGKVVFGCESGEVFALNENTGEILWKTAVGGSVKGAPAYNDGVVYVGDYSGQLTAINVADGEVRWESDAQGGGLGSAGTFYATPTVAFGRVYIGSKDSRMYSFEASSGDLAWSHSTGDEIYAGAAVASTPETPPTVYFGSLDGNVYALDAKNGEERWTKDAGGGVFGAGSVIGGVFYAANLGKSSTIGYSIQDGERVFHSNNGGYNPVISDGRRIYLTGYQNVSALKPAGPAKTDAAREANKAGGQGDGSEGENSG